MGVHHLKHRTETKIGMFDSVAPVPLYQQVAARIRDAIIAGRFRPGDALPGERELADTFRVSRASVREALRQLEAQGLVSGGRTTQGRTVAAASMEMVSRALADGLALRQIALQDLVELRCVVEAAALHAIPGPRTIPELIKEATDALAEMRRDDIDIAGYDQADVRFHAALVGASGNEAMHVVMRACRDAQVRYLAEGLSRVADPQAVLARLTDEHTAILDAVAAGNGDRAAELVRAHILGFYRSDYEW